MDFLGMRENFISMTVDNMVHGIYYFVYIVGGISSHDVSTRMSLNLEVSNDFCDTL